MESLLKRVSLVCLSLAISIVLGGCATDETNEGGRAPASFFLPDNDGMYTADAMHFRKPMPSHPSTAQPSDYFFKRCAQEHSATYYSKTNYSCD
jgi:hypothetical protein